MIACLGVVITRRIPRRVGIQLSDAHAVVAGGPPVAEFEHHGRCSGARHGQGVGSLTPKALDHPAEGVGIGGKGCLVGLVCQRSGLQSAERLGADLLQVDLAPAAATPPTPARPRSTAERRPGGSGRGGQDRPLPGSGRSAAAGLPVNLAPEGDSGPMRPHADPLPSDKAPDDGGVPGHQATGHGTEAHGPGEGRGDLALRRVGPLGERRG